MRKSSKTPNQRQLRVGEEIKHTLSEVFIKEDVPIEDFNTSLLTVTEVKISPDLKNASAFVMTLNGELVDEVIQKLNEKAYFARMLIAKKMNLRHTPQIKFIKDITFDEASKINKLLQNTSRE